ncbi:MBL fold metallo-hydrolase [Schleiferia thermophila]|jgi:glyoxylase-like metal-dependent hydrolase (beta-lactamase superfamily II)|uniref:Glyoxylase-like metal-dependent hydrolase (Beta-lactamase superfamily II) n=1 Tax=Schleiferia thermophila TaxID=884107 RepID=A0A369A3X7_9FLAO|nr:MBL fold metallo-hydrolase [Schleiferia thermophila]KFD39740.1 beta-lactamase [Schleiferia thermophila str. Yellowstone]PMB36885.1 MBL fold metallo-hydrolase [Fischerella thermalis CCMEE 5319]RCX03939.1 glyoxylase-like metal-dependent hydrolase (beta-lactamase superfamily II) [Schleiferia thermophila]GCD80173.1 MBL fold metallo-hydrolase [Schleiferia thermophila]
MQLHIIETGNFKLDGGAMFGVVPKSLWGRVYPADENNMCTWAMRCLLVENGDKLILIDTGIGDKQDEKFFSFYYLHGEESLLNSIKRAGFSPDDITDVLLTHLHFDHCGGAVSRRRDGNGFEPTFRNAVYWVHDQHLHWALHPNPREKASFLKENIQPLIDSGQLSKFHAPAGRSSTELGFDIYVVYGHTEAQILPIIQTKNASVMYMADLMPSSYHIPLPWVMAYDVRPLLTMQEKEEVLQMAMNENMILFFEHDAYTQAALVEATEKGVRVKSRHRLMELL